jgi:hypothetical protein
VVVVAEGHRFELPQNGLQTNRFLTPLAAGPVASTQWLPVDANAPADCMHEKGLQMQAFPEAADGIRTHDLLHGKQNVQRRFPQNMPANRRFLGTSRLRVLPGIHREITGVWVVNG